MCLCVSLWTFPYRSNSLNSRDIEIRHLKSSSLSFSVVNCSKFSSEENDNFFF